MGIEKMMLVNIAGQLKNLDRTLLKCIDSNCFHIEQASDTLDMDKTGFTQLHEHNPYHDVLSKLVSIDFGNALEFKETDFRDVEALTDEEVSSYVDSISSSMRKLNDDIVNVKNSIAQYEQILTQLRHLHGMEIDMESLFKCKHIHVRFGKLPADSYPKLSYYGSQQFVFVHYDCDKNYYWGLYCAPTEHLARADKIMNDLYFERIWVPDYVTGKPDEEISDVQNKFDQAEIEQRKLLRDRESLIEKEKQNINKIFCRLKFSYDCFELRSKASVLKDKFYLVGFVTEKDAKSFTKLFSDIPEVSVVLKPPDSEQNIQIPVKMKMNRFTKPFSLFVEMYGLPSYDGFNPVNLVAITYTILFGIMFGDLGQGLVISLLGAILYKKTRNKLCAIMTRIGISSAVFGAVFGSVFGFEHVLDPVYHAIGFKEKPIEVIDNVNFVLGAAIAIGVLLIVISMIINIVTTMRKKEFDQAVFGNNGITGLVFFSSLIYALVSSFLFGNNVFSAAYVIFLLVVPLILMLLREPLGYMLSGKQYKSDGAVDFIASNFFEVFEFLLGYVTNTLSFVRIGGFVLSHAAMMSVVMMFTQMYPNASPVIIVLGNIFVMGMEGMLVGIQVLRLEFYEIFSRCYDGDGKAYEPVSVKYTTDFE
ncbi:MAG: V-type ATPase 116kDa subunit family protein [Oscillospiraceae bacterium]|nr:V-type ATPase 116kDa subunit family protein [Oscillospiraceae bacterium]